VLVFAGMASSAPEISPRHRFEARIDIRLQRGEQKTSLQGWARDLSESGLRAFVADPLEKGETVVLEIPLSGSGKQVIPAKVARSLGTDYGFEFTALSAAQRSHIQATLRNCQQLSRAPTGATIWS
jgi:PilZ domain